MDHFITADDLEDIRARHHRAEEAHADDGRFASSDAHRDRAVLLEEVDRLQPIEDAARALSMELSREDVPAPHRQALLDLQLALDFSMGGEERSSAREIVGTFARWLAAGHGRKAELWIDEEGVHVTLRRGSAEPQRLVLPCRPSHGRAASAGTRADVVDRVMTALALSTHVAEHPDAGDPRFAGYEAELARLSA